MGYAAYAVSILIYNLALDMVATGIGPGVLPGLLRSAAWQLYGNVSQIAVPPNRWYYYQISSAGSTLSSSWFEMQWQHGFLLTTVLC